MLTHTLIFLAFSLILSLLFFLYGFNHYYLLNAGRKYKSPSLPEQQSVLRPRISIHIPIYNEKYVIPRLIAACTRAAEAYDREKVNIIIADDSDDETAGVIDETVKSYIEKGFKIEVLRRENRQGFKAGALQNALQHTDEEYIAIFDSDFTPPADFLVQAAPYFCQNENLGIIQCRWTHLNRDYNNLTRAIAIGIDVHFLIEQAGRYVTGCFQNFNGSGGILSRKALLQAGGWHADTLTEDLDVSYRIQMQGYRILFLRDILCPGEIPPTVPSFKKQQGRWACGSLRTAKKHLPALLKNKEFGFMKRLEAFIHLTGYAVHPLMFISFLLACLATLFKTDNFRIAEAAYQFMKSISTGTIQPYSVTTLQYFVWILFGLLIVLCTTAAWIPPIVVLRKQNLPIARKPIIFIVLFLLGFGVSASNTIEAGKALLTNRIWSFSRTPKYAVRLNKDAWQDKSYQVPLDYVSLLELASVCLGALSIAYAIWSSNIGVLLILAPFTTAYAFVFLLTILQSRAERA